MALVADSHLVSQNYRLATTRRHQPVIASIETKERRARGHCPKLMKVAASSSPQYAHHLVAARIPSIGKALAVQASRQAAIIITVVRDPLPSKYRAISGNS